MEIIWTSDLLKIAIPCITGLIALIIFAIGSKLKWWASFSAGKNGFEIKTADEKAKEEQKEFESGNINKLLDDHILECDAELVDYALEQSNKLRRTLNIQLNKQVACSGTRRSLASCLRYPLWEASRKNHFKDVLRPENTKNYIEHLLKEVIEEYQSFAIERENAFCTNEANIKCPDLPPLDEVLEMLKRDIIERWAMPIRRKVIEICGKKINLYNEFIPSFRDLGDNVRIKRSELCIGKNEEYKIALMRKPEPGEI